MMGGRKFFVTGLAVFSFLLMSVSAYAATMTVDGTLYFVDNIPNDYGVTAGTISWTAEYNDTLIGVLQYVGDFDFSLPGGISYGLDDFPSTGKPWVVFDGSDITQLVFSSSTFSGDGTGLPTLISKEDTDEFTLDGVDLHGDGFLRFTPIPIPGAVWLLGTGLTGLAGFRKRFMML